jgi:hypothetical protein
MTNNFQNGATSSQLSPQAFKNSNQNVNFQETYSVSGAQTSNSTRALQSVTPGILRVDDGSSTQVLGVSTKTATAQQYLLKPEQSKNYVPLSLVVLLVSAGLAIYFFKRFKKSPTEVVEEQSEDEE